MRTRVSKLPDILEAGKLVSLNVSIEEIALQLQKSRKTIYRYLRRYYEYRKQDTR